MFRDGLLRQMSYNDQIVLIPIDKASEMKNEIIGRCRFQQLKNKLAEDIDPFQVLSEADTVRERFNRLLDSLFHHEIYYFKEQRQRFNLETDIIGSLNQMTHYVVPGKNAIFIFSDMIQESAEANLTKLDSTASIEKKISELLETAQIPNMEDTIIFVCGATEKSKERYRLNKYFWSLFFEKAKAEIKDYGYGNADRIAEVIAELREERRK
jgi:hypothetical protein